MTWLNCTGVSVHEGTSRKSLSTSRTASWNYTLCTSMSVSSICECVCVCVSVGGGAGFWTRWHIQKVIRMTHGDLYERMPSRSSARPLLNKKGKKGAARQPVWVVHADISDRKLERGDRVKNIGVHNGWKSRGSVLEDTGMKKRENKRREEVCKESRGLLSNMTLL